MATEKVTMYSVACDVCGRVHESDNIVAWGDASTAEEMAANSEWQIDNGEACCPNCIDNETTSVSDPDGLYTQP